MNRSESKYFHTAQKMDEALLHLLEQKEFAYITIQEVCRAAGVHRTTFYLHYQNLRELLDESIVYMSQQFYAYFASLPERTPDTPLLSAEYLLPYLAYVREHRRLFQAAIRQSAVFGTQMQFETLFREYFAPQMERIPSWERPYWVAFYLHGILAVVQEWLRGDCQESISEIAALILRCAHLTPPEISKEP